MGIAGWATSGGHGWLTGFYDQGANDIYEVELVTAAGDIMVSNEGQDTDVFWAMRGDGGRTYGATTKMTIKAYLVPRFRIMYQRG